MANETEPMPGLKSGPGGAAGEKEREFADVLDQALHRLWDLGRNIILVWAPKDRGMKVLVIPHYIISEAAAPEEDFSQPNALGLAPRSFIEDVIANPKHVTEEGVDHLAGLLGFEPEWIDLPFVPGEDLGFDSVEDLVKRYSISYVEDRAVMLFDIVGFSLYSPLEQVTQLNSMAYSLNSAHSKMLNKEININFARTTTGDGFYIWNRDRGIRANVNLYHFMHLALADNAIARRKSSRDTTPELRACFHVGSHYEFYQSEGLSPTIYSYIVGDVTIELARMIDRALPGQVLVGDFQVQMPDRDTRDIVKIDTVQFIERTQQTLSDLEGLVLSDEHIESIQCYLTGGKQGDGGFAIKKYLIADKHGRTRNVYNAKINIYRGQAEPIYLGIQTSALGDFAFEREEYVDG